MKLATFALGALAVAGLATAQVAPQCSGPCEFTAAPKTIDDGRVVSYPPGGSTIQAVEGQVRTFIRPANGEGNENGNFTIRLFYRGPLGGPKAKELVAETEPTLAGDFPLLDVDTNERGLYSWEVENFADTPSRISFFSDYPIWDSCDGYCPDILGNPMGAILADDTTTTPSGCICTVDCVLIDAIGSDPSGGSFGCCADYTQACPSSGLLNPNVPFDVKQKIRAKHADQLAQMVGLDSAAQLNAAQAGPAACSGAQAAPASGLSTGAAVAVGAAAAIASVAVGAGAYKVISARNTAKANLAQIEASQA